MMSIRLYTFFLICTTVVACANPSGNETIRIHNSSGLSEHPSDYTSYDPSTAVPDDDGRFAALKELADKDAAAAYDLGLRFFRGDGVRQDSYQAIQWMRNAAERGNLDAQKALGRLYLTGLEEMGSDPQEAEKWLRIAASHGDKESATLLEEATAARKKETDYYRWKTYWQPRFYHSWYYGYHYRYYWRHGRWWY